MPLLTLIALWYCLAPDAIHTHGLYRRIDRGSELVVDGNIRGVASITDCCKPLFSSACVIYKRAYLSAYVTRLK